MKENLVKIKDTPYVYLDTDLFEGTLEEISQKVLDVKNKLALAISTAKEHNKDITPIESYKKIRLNFDYIERELKLIGFREQTAQEIKEEKKRQKELRDKFLKAKAEAKEKKESDELALYEKLKEKYG